jgi:hypothetical protein
MSTDLLKMNGLLEEYLGSGWSLVKGKRFAKQKCAFNTGLVFS